MKASDIDYLHTAGFITQPQREAILAHLLDRPAQEIPPPQRIFIYFLATLAALLIVSGAIVLAVSHWQAIPPIMKSASGMLIMALAWAGCWWLRVKKPLVSEGLGLLGAGMWGANIVLHGRLFELNNPPVEGFFLFFIGVLPIPFLLRQRILIGIVMICSFLLLAEMLTAPESSWLSMAWLSRFDGTAWSLFMALLLIWWMVGEKCRGSLSICRDYFWVGFPTYAAFLCVVQFYLLYGGEGMRTLECNWVIFAVLALLAPLFKPRQASWLHWISVAAASIALLPLAIHLSWHTAYREVLGMLICAAFSGAFMVVGVRSGRLTWTYISIVMMAFIFFDLLVRIAHSLSDSGLFLMALGAAVLVFAYALEKQRRFLVDKAKKNALPPLPKA